MCNRHNRIHIAQFNFTAFLKKWSNWNGTMRYHKKNDSKAKLNKKWLTEKEIENIMPNDPKKLALSVYVSLYVSATKIANVQN